jgi:hypothetical protein
VVETMQQRGAHHAFAPASRNSPKKMKRRTQASPNRLDNSVPKSHARIALPSSAAWLVQRRRSSRFAFVVANGSHLCSSAQRKTKKTFSVSASNEILPPSHATRSDRSDRAIRLCERFSLLVSKLHIPISSQTPTPISDSIQLHGTSTGIAAVVPDYTMLKVHTDTCNQADHQAEPLCTGLTMKPSKLVLRASAVHLMS